MEILYLDCKNPFRLCLATRVLFESLCVSNTYEKLEMDADWWKNDAAKVNEMESAMVNKKLQWKSVMEII